MKCEKVQKALGLTALEEGTVWQRWLLRWHLRGCADCRAALTEMQWLEAQMPRWRNDAPMPDLQARIQATLTRAALSEATDVPAPLPLSSRSLLYWLHEFKENTTMKRRFAWSMLLVFVITAGLLSSTLWTASARTRLSNMKKALQGIRSIHVSVWENTSLPGKQFYRREMWVQGSLLRQYIPGKLWMISTSDKNWYYLAEEDRLMQQAHKQPPVTFDFLSSNFKGIRGDGKGVLIEADRETTWRGRDVIPIRVTEAAPTAEELAAEKAQQEAAQHEMEELYREKGLTLPIREEEKSTSLPERLHSRRSLYWVDKATNLPLHSEDYNEEEGQWVLYRRSDYTYNEALPANLFDPQDLLRVGRREVKRQTAKP